MDPQAFSSFSYFATNCTNMLKPLHVSFYMIKHVNLMGASFVANLARVRNLVVYPSHGDIFLDQVVKFIIYKKS